MAAASAKAGCRATSPQAAAGQPQSRSRGRRAGRAERCRADLEVMVEWKGFAATNAWAQMAATGRESSDRLFKDGDDKFVDCSGRLLKLIESAPSDPACLNSMLWHVEQYWISGTHGTLNDQLLRSVDVLLRHYSDEPRVAWRVLAGRNGMPTRLDDRLLTGLAAASRRRETKGLALMALGRYLEDKVCFVIQAKRSDGPFLIESFTGGLGTTRIYRVYDEAYERVLRSCDAAALGRETESIFARIVAEYADVVQADRDPGDPEYPSKRSRIVIGEEAASRLSAHRSVTNGQPAPELSWTTQDGRTSKLSGLSRQGRGPGLLSAAGMIGRRRVTLSRESEAMRELKGQPFVLIGFSHKDPGETGFSFPFKRPDGSEAVPAVGPIPSS